MKHRKAVRKMDEKSFEEILKMIINACNNRFYKGVGDNQKTVIECATQIYIAQMNTHALQSCCLTCKYFNRCRNEVVGSRER